MNIIDVCIIALIALCGVTGLKHGFFKQTVITAGTILVFVLAYLTKDYLANFLSYNLPFFDFVGPFQGLSTVNIIMYQMVSFIIMTIIYSLILGILIKITNVFEKILNFTIILGIPSKILGFLLGIIEGYVLVFIALFFLAQPAVHIDIINDSKLMPRMLQDSFGLSKFVSPTTNTIFEMYDIVDDYNKTKDKDEFNYRAIDIMLKNKMIKTDYVENLIEKDKISIPNINNIIDKYKEE